MKHGQILAFAAALAVTTGGIVALAAPASAADQVVVRAEADVRIAHVRYADLNIANPAGQKLLNRRVGQAVHSVCDGSASYATFQSEGFCRTAAWGSAKPQIERAIERAQLMASLGLKDVNAPAIAIAL